MELYYKDLISEDASLEKLVEDLMCVVQGVEEFTQVAGASLEPELKEKLASRLERLKATCRQLEDRAIAGAIATDRLVHAFPYSAAGFAFGFGLLLGALLPRGGRARRLTPRVPAAGASGIHRGG